MLLLKRPKDLASKVDEIVPLCPGRIGLFVQSTTVHPQDEVTFDKTRGLSPLFVIENVAVAGFFHSTSPKSYAFLSKSIFAWAIAVDVLREIIVNIESRYFIFIIYLLRAKINIFHLKEELIH